MIKKLRVTVDGSSYDVTVELPDEPAASAAAPAPVTAPAAPADSAPAPAPASVPAAASPLPAVSGNVPSPLAGRVTSVIVTIGQQVKEGDHLITLEAMKMNTFVFAPKSGHVAAIKTEVGAAVEDGQVLMQLE